jgi:cell division protein FtsQ
VFPVLIPLRNPQAGNGSTSRYSEVGDSHDLDSGVAKIDSTTSRASALADDQPLDQFYRPAVAPKQRPERPLPIDEQEAQEEEAFLRARRRVPVRKGILPRTRMGRIVFAGVVLASLAALVLVWIAVRNFLDHDPRFRIETSSSIQIVGNSQVTRPELLAVFGSDIGRNVFFVPLADRRVALENLPWVWHATVMRLLPNQLRVAIVERTPVAFVRNGNEVGLVDVNGVMLRMAPALIAANHYSFPVVTGIERADPLSVRAARMQLYQRFVAELDSGGEKISEQLSEVDLSDPEDVRALVPAESSDLLLHLGDQEFLSRFHSYQAHIAEWRQQYPSLRSVDLRYDHQVVLEMRKGTTVAEASSGNEGNTGAQAPAAGLQAAKAGAANHVMAKRAMTKKRAGTNR